MPSEIQGDHLEAKLHSITDSFVCNLKAALQSECEALCTSCKQIIAELKQQLQVANDRIAGLEQALDKENWHEIRGTDSSLDEADATAQILSDAQQATQCSLVKHGRGLLPSRQPVFKETIRNKQERKRMHGHDCPCCMKVKHNSSRNVLLVLCSYRQRTDTHGQHLSTSLSQSRAQNTTGLLECRFFVSQINRQPNCDAFFTQALASRLLAGQRRRVNSSMPWAYT